MRKIRRKFTKGNITEAIFTEEDMICNSNRRRKIRNNRRLLRVLRFDIRKKRKHLEKKIEFYNQHETQTNDIQEALETTRGRRVKRKKNDNALCNAASLDLKFCSGRCIYPTCCLHPGCWSTSFKEKCKKNKIID